MPIKFIIIYPTLDFPIYSQHTQTCNLIFSYHDNLLASFNS
jgi:hypothetical protein